MSCRTVTPILTSSQDSTIIRERVRDSLVFVPADSALFKAWLECDSAGNVMMTQIEALRGKRVNISGIRLSPDKVSGRTLLQLSAIADSLAIKLRLKELEIERLKSQTVTITVPAALKWWQKGLMASGGVFILCIILLIAVTVSRLTKK